MLYDFSETRDGDCITENQNKAELIREVDNYYRGVAIEDNNPEWEACGFIRTIDQFGEFVNMEVYHAAGYLPERKSEKPYLQSEFI